MSVKVDLDFGAMQAWLKSEAMAEMLTRYAAREFKDYQTKVMGSRVIVVSKDKPQELLKKAKGGGRR